MTGPQHYLKAEEHLGHARSSGDDPKTELIHLGYAQVHATLALAAATALGAGRADDHGMLPDDANAWQDAAGLPWQSTAEGGRA